MPYLLLLLLFIPASRVFAYNPDSLKILAHQADYVALVEMDPRPLDSIPAMTEDLGTVYYMPRFRVLRVFKENTLLPDSSFIMVLSNFDPRFRTLYQPGEKYYIFLSMGLPKEPDLSASLLPYGKTFGQPMLLPGGIIRESGIYGRKIRQLTKPSALARAAEKGNNGKLLRLIKHKHRNILFLQSLQKNNQVRKTPPPLFQWLSKQQGIAGWMTDTCSIHICIWPGWTDHLFWVNTREGMKEYHFAIQHGSTYGCCCLRWTSERSRIKKVSPAPGGREQFFRTCELNAENERRDRYNNLVQLTLDEGRLTWSVVNAPLHLDSDGKLIRLKVTLTNHGDSALHVRWPGRQNHSGKILRFALHHRESGKVYHELPFLSLPHDETLGPEELLLAAGASVSAWHSLNDSVFGGTDAATSHHFESLPPGTYSVQAIYQAYPGTQQEYPCWEPFVDSITAWTGYPYHLQNNDAAEPIRVRCQVVETAQLVKNEYEHQTLVHGIVEVMENPSPLGPKPGSLIAWKMTLPANTRDFSRGRPPYMHELVKPGDPVEINIHPRAYPGMITTPSGKYPLFLSPGDLSFYRTY